MMAARRLSICSNSNLLLKNSRVVRLFQSINSDCASSSFYYSTNTSPSMRIRCPLNNNFHGSHFSTDATAGRGGLKPTNAHRRGVSRQYNPSADAQNKQKKNHLRHHNQQTNTHKRHRTPFHSVRLTNETAARETTLLFTQLQQRSNNNHESFQKTNITKKGHTPLWRDRASLLAAEQALEFWAHRNNHHNQQQQRRNNNNNNNRQQQSSSHQLERDAQTALDLFTSLSHFHGQEAKLSNGGFDVSVLTNGMYSHVIDALSKSPKVEHVGEADRLLRQFISLYLAENSGSTTEGDLISTLQELGLPFPTTNYNDDSDDPTTIPQKMPLSISWNYKDKHHFPNQIRITGVMRGQVRQKCPVEAESLLHLKIKLAAAAAAAAAPSKTTTQRNMFQPNEIGYATVIDGYSRICDGENAERILQLMKGRFGNDDDTTTRNGANVVAYNAAISAWARSASRRTDDGDDALKSSKSAAENAEQLLREMWSLQQQRGKTKNDHRDVNNPIVPDVVSYSSVISAYASCLDRSFGLKRAEELLFELEGLAEKEYNESTTHDYLNQQQQQQQQQQQHHASKSRGGGGRHPDGFQLNSTVYNALLQAYANAGDTSSAENLLDRMISLHSRSLNEGGGGGPFKKVRPNTRTFNVVLNSWAKKGTREAGAKANELLLKMEDMSAVYRDRMNQPDIITYNTVLAAWSKSAGYGQKKAPSDTKEIVGEEAAYKALELLDRIERQSLFRIKPDRISYSTTIAAFANAAQTCESGVLMAQKADALLSRMRDQMGVEPDDYSFNGVLLAWSRSSGGMSSAQHCESILRSMKNPTNISWSTVINAYAQAGGALEAAALLKEMEEGRAASESVGQQSSSSSSSHASKTTTLPIVVYNNVIHAWSRSTDPDASKYAEAILNRLEGGGLFSSSCWNLPKPDIISYRLVLNALEHTKDPDKAERAKSILDRCIASLPAVSELDTINTQLKDNNDIQGAYNSVLAACAYTPSNAGDQARNNAARILVETLRDLNNNSKIVTLGPNQESFSIFLQGCTHLFPPGSSSDRTILMRAALQECCEKGFLTPKIWDKFCTASSEEDVQSFLSGIEEKGDDGSFEALPFDWSRNASV